MLIFWRPVRIMEEYWLQALSLLSNRLGQEEIDRWLRPLEPTFDRTAMNVHLESPNRFFVEWVREHYLPYLQEALGRSLGGAVEITLSAEGPTPPLGTVPPLPPKTFTASNFDGLTGRYSFANFVVGAGNQFAHAAAFAAANLPGQTYNPLFLYGRAGLGKTHLLCAVGHHILSRDRLARVVYLSSEDFTNQMIQAIRNKTMDSFRNHYRSTDVLLLDDVHFLGSKERSQEEFFFTFNALYESGRQIILTSDLPPKDIPGLEDRLRSRFEWGLIADIQAPDRETKIAILKKKAKEQAIVLSDDVLNFLISTKEINIRVLEGYLIRVAAYASLTGKPISLDLTKQVLKDFLIDKEISVEDVLRLVAQHYNIRLTDIRSAKKTRQISEPRQIAMFLARQLTKAPLVKIGQIFGGKDHSTVVHAVKKISARMAKDMEFKREIKQIKETILQHR